jgi:hypothetical protein
LLSRNRPHAPSAFDHRSVDYAEHDRAPTVNGYRPRVAASYTVAQRLAHRHAHDFRLNRVYLANI